MQAVQFKGLFNLGSKEDSRFKLEPKPMEEDTRFKLEPKPVLGDSFVKLSGCCR